MSLTQDHGDIVFECDKCHATLATNTSNFDAARNLLKRERWQPIKRADGEWAHHCDQCKAEQRRLV